MKKIVTLTCVSLFFVASVLAQAAGLDNVINALNAGNAAELSKHLDNSVEISLPSKTDNYNRQQATVILQDFFATNGVKSFDVKHKGDNGGSQFCIGTLLTKSGSYRTTFFMTVRNGQQFVKEIRFQSL